jgi:hypothetical protein
VSDLSFQSRSVFRRTACVFISYYTENEEENNQYLSINGEFLAFLNSKISNTYFK